MPTSKPTSDTTHEGLVLVGYGQTCLVETPTKDLLRCALRKKLPRAICGDRVAYEIASPQSGIVTHVYDRKTTLTRPDQNGRIRPIAANIDQIVIVITSQPRFSYEMLDRYIAASELIGTDSVIVVNKMDLLSESEQAEITRRLAVYSSLGYPCIFTSILTTNGLSSLHQQLVSGTSILVGQSGVGKSSLTQALIPDKEIRTGSLSKVTGLGRHTTTAATLYHLPGGGSIIDSPGIRDFTLGKVSVTDLMQGFVEFKPYLGLCRFHNCKHATEPGCAITTAARQKEISEERHLHYKKLAQECS